MIRMRRGQVLESSLGLTHVATLVSGGFAVVQPESQLSINAVEGYSLEDFSADVSFLYSSTLNCL